MRTKKKPVLLDQCQNSKSRKLPDVQCPHPAVVGGSYCSRHAKHPRPFRQITPWSPAARTAATRIQAAWRFWKGLARFRTQGPVACPELAHNTTELFSLEDSATIPLLYRIMYRDPAGLFWMFDVRTLQQYMSRGTTVANPYTREPFTDTFLANLRARIRHLINRRVSVQHASPVLTEDQRWNQHALSVFLAIEEHGYLVSSDWFNAFTLSQHRQFYKIMYTLWNSILTLTVGQRREILPGYQSRAGTPFPFTPEDILYDAEKGLKWWKKRNLHLLESFATRGREKEHRATGALYCLTGLVQISGLFREAFPWLADASLATV